MNNNIYKEINYGDNLFNIELENFSKETLPFSQSRRNCARTGKKHSSSSKVPLHFLATVPKMQEAVLRRMYERFFYECKAQ